jgi:uncharacterized protein (TIGR03435 family)
MLRSLLEDRFKLALRYERRQRPVFALVVAKPGKLGQQLRAHMDDKTREAVPDPAEEPPQTGVKAITSPSVAAVLALQRYPCDRVVGGRLPGDAQQVWSGGRRVSMEAIASSLGGMEQFERPIINRTGLQGTFDFTVQWNSQLQNLQINAPPGTTGASLTEAIQEQLGLKLESAKGPVEVLVIESVSRPTEN